MLSCFPPTTVWTMCGLCMRKLLTVWKTSRRPSAFTLSRMLLRAMKVPVRPAPALKQEGRGYQQPRHIMHTLEGLWKRSDLLQDCGCEGTTDILEMHLRGQAIKCEIRTVFLNNNAAIKLLWSQEHIPFPFKGKSFREKRWPLGNSANNHPHLKRG